MSWHIVLASAEPAAEPLSLPLASHTDSVLGCMLLHRLKGTAHYTHARQWQSYSYRHLSSQRKAAMPLPAILANNNGAQAGPAEVPANMEVEAALLQVACLCFLSHALILLLIHMLFEPDIKNTTLLIAYPYLRLSVTFQA